jgi:uncharacterized protein YdhG (YjbR/CyaY superfamily)
MMTAKSIDEHIKTLPKDVAKLVQSIRETVHKAAPDAVEGIKYGLPTFILQGKNLVHFAGYKEHIGFYPAPSGIEAFKKDLAKYNTGKGTLRFSLDEPIPLPLIRKVVLFRVKETLAKVKAGKKKSGAY